MKKIIKTKNAPSPVGPYNQAILFNNTLYASGQIAINPLNNQIINEDIEAETKQVMEKIADELAMGKSLVKICKNKAMPSYRSITNAVRKDDELWEIYRRGRVQQAEFYGDHIIDLATSQLPENMDPRFMNAEVQRSSCLLIQ